MEYNLIETAVIPEVPKVIPNEQLYVYVPVASNSTLGIALFNKDDFNVENGKVSINGDYLDIDEIIAGDNITIVKEDGKLIISGVAAEIEIAQETGTGKNVVMSQDATTKALTTLNNSLSASITAQVGSLNVQLSNEIAKTNNNVTNINNKIPNQASVDNKLADKAFVNSSVQTATANFRGAWETWTDVPAVADSYPADFVGNKTPGVNDYMVLLNASTQDNLISGTWRYKYSGNWATLGKTGWLPEYQVNEEPLTSDQVAALNSGITADKVNAIDNKLDKVTTTGLMQVYAINSNGQQVMFRVSSYAVQSAIPMYYNSRGSMKVGIGITDNDAVNKKQMEDAISSASPTSYFVELSGQSGTITQEQYNKLSADKTSYLVFTDDSRQLEFMRTVTASDGSIILVYSVIEGNYSYSCNVKQNLTFNRQTFVLEIQSNKLQTLSSSSTTAQYPSAKAVVDYVAEQINAIDIQYIELSVPASSTQGTLTAAQLATLKANDLNGIVFDHEYYKLSAKGHVEGYRTYYTVERENGATMIKTITITESTLAWVLFALDVEQKPVDESYTIATAMWRDLSGNSPYKYMVSVTATYTIVDKTEVGIINDQPVAFANYGFVVGSVSNQTVVIFAIDKPTAEINLSVRYRG